METFDWTGFPFNIQRIAFDKFMQEKDFSNNKELVKALKNAKDAYIAHFGEEFMSDKKYHGYFFGSAISEHEELPNLIAIICDDKKLRIVQETEAIYLNK